jgi:lysophospholipase L1-like esterase
MRRDAVVDHVRGDRRGRQAAAGWRVPLAAALVLAVLLAIASPAVGAAPKDERVYLALGNSLAAGVGATRADRVGYVPRLAEFFRGTAHGGATSLVNLAVPAATSGSFISSGRLAEAVAAIDDESDVVVVTLDIGGNDLLGLLGPGQPCAADPTTPACRAAIRAALAGFATHFPIILTQLTEALARDPGEEQLLVATFYNPFSGTGGVFDTVVDLVALGSDLELDTNCSESQEQFGLNDLIACIAGRYSQSGVTVVDVYPLFVGKAASLTHVRDNDIHPTNAGYAAIANAFRRASKTGD